MMCMTVSDGACMHGGDSVGVLDVHDFNRTPRSALSLNCFKPQKPNARYDTCNSCTMDLQLQHQHNFVFSTIFHNLCCGTFL